MVGFGFSDAASLAVSMWLGNDWDEVVPRKVVTILQFLRVSPVRKRSYCSLAAPNFRSGRQLVKSGAGSVKS